MSLDELALQELPDSSLCWKKEIRCKDPKCEVIFIPNLPQQEYCSSVCRKRVKNRKKEERRRLAAKKHKKILPIIDLICLNCNKKLSTTSTARKFCDLYCSRSYHKAKYRNAKKPVKTKKEHREKFLNTHAERHFNVTLSKEEIDFVANSTPHVKLEYVIYFLWRNDIVVYVGKSAQHYYERIHTHCKKRNDGIWDFTHVTYHVHGQLKGLTQKENRYIYHYINIGQCEYNNPLPGRPTTNKTKKYKYRGKIKEYNDDEFFII